MTKLIIIFIILAYFEIGFILAVCCFVGERCVCAAKFPWKIVWGWGFRLLGEKIYNRIVY
jgi:hypothetical protein